MIIFFILVILIENERHNIMEKQEVIKREYFRNIEFFRFILIMAIVLFHISNIIKGYNIPFFKYVFANTRYSFAAVEMFFVIAGFFLFYTMNLKQDFYDFVKHKLIRLFPVILFVFVCGYIISAFTPLEMKHYENFWALILVQNLGITKAYTDIGATWYISCLFWTSCLYFYMYKNIKTEYFNIILSIAIIFCISYIVHSPIIGPICHYAVFLNCGMLRAISCMGLGYFIWNIYCSKLIKIKTLNLNLVQTLLITVLEGYLTVFIIQNILIKKMDYNNYFILVFAFIILFICLLIKKGYVSKLLDNNFSRFIGRYVYSILITHEMVIRLIVKFFKPSHRDLIINHPYLYFLSLFILIIIIGIITHHLVEKRIINYLKNLKIN